jgi:cysteine synthase A
MITDSIAELIGRTPLVRLDDLAGAGGVELFAKWEGANPGGSVKDRVALALVGDGERRGILPPGGELVEPTSGNTGIGLALVGRAKGYRVTVVLPEGYSEERVQLLRALGAGVERTPAAEGMASAIRRAEGIAAERGAWQPGQFTNRAVIEMHRNTTAREIIADLPGGPDALVCGVGTAGTLTGCALALRESNPGIEVYAVEPAASPVLSGGEPGTHGIQGIGAGFVPPFYDPDLVDGVIKVTDAEAFRACRELAARTGLLAGPSSGAALAACRRLVREGFDGRVIVTMLPDRGDRYLSTGLFASGLERTGDFE